MGISGWETETLYRRAHKAFIGKTKAITENSLNRTALSGAGLRCDFSAGRFWDADWPHAVVGVLPGGLPGRVPNWLIVKNYILEYLIYRLDSSSVFRSASMSSCEKLDTKETISSVEYFFLIILITICLAFILTVCCFSSSCLFSACCFSSSCLFSACCFSSSNIFAACVSGS